MYKIYLSEKENAGYISINNPEELLDFAKAEIKKSLVNDSSSDALEIYLDETSHSVVTDGRRVFLSPKEYDVMNYMYANRGKLVTNDELYDELWQAGGFTDCHAIAVCVHRLRRKIESDAKNPVFLKNVWGAGYVLC